MPREPKPRRFGFLDLVVAAYCLGLLGVVLTLHVLADAWWLATVALFGPRWVWAVPLVVLVPLALLRRRLLLLPLAAAAVVVLWPVMGLRVSPGGTSHPQSAAEGSLRFMTYNVGGDVKPDPGELEAIIAEIAPHVIVLQEYQQPLDPSLLAAKGYELRENTGMGLVTRLPIKEVHFRDPMDFYKMNGSGRIEGYVLDFEGRDVFVMNVHLETVREGLAEVRRRAWKGAPELRANIEQRERESTAAREYFDAKSGPRIAAGDFNLPVESDIFDRHWSDLRDTFDEKGFGFGTSKVTPFFGLRIDHILVGSEWTVEHAWVGRDFGGDHRPVVADLRLK